LRYTDLKFAVTLPAEYGSENELLVKLTSVNDPNMQAIAQFQLKVQLPQVIHSRDVKADVAIVLEDNYKMGIFLPMIADALETFWAQQWVTNKGPTKRQIASFLQQFDENTLLTAEALQAFFKQFEQAVNDDHKPVLELITYTPHEVTSHLITDNIGEVIGYIRRLQLYPTQNCSGLTTTALQYALENLADSGQIILATTGALDLERVTAELLRERGVKTHIFMNGSCQDEVFEKALFKEFSQNTQGLFYSLPQTLTVDNIAEKLLQEMITNILMKQSCSSSIYAVQDHGLNNSEFFTITPDSFEINALSKIYPGYDIEALAIHPDTCLLYAASSADAVKHPGSLYLLSKQTGKLTRIGRTGFTGIEGLAFDSESNLWGWAEKAGLVKINPNTAKAELILASQAKVEDIAWDYAHNLLYTVQNDYLWVWDGIQLTQIYPLPQNIEGLEILPNDLLLLGIHGKSNLLSIQLVDLKTRNKIDEIDIPIDPYDDLEGIAY